jgi:hypothetical protein
VFANAFACGILRNSGNFFAFTAIEHYVRNADCSGFFHNAALGVFLGRFGMSFDNVNTFHNNLATTGKHLEDFAGFAGVFTGDYHYGIIFFDMRFG